MNNNQSGIYEIQNAITGDRYIGQSVCIEKRWTSHKHELVAGQHCNPHFQRAWDKYGAGAFKFRILVVCEPEELTRYEQGMVDSRKPEYNIRRECVNSALGLHSHHWMVPEAHRGAWLPSAEYQKLYKAEQQRRLQCSRHGRGKRHHQHSRRLSLTKVCVGGFRANAVYVGHKTKWHAHSSRKVAEWHD